MKSITAVILAVCLGGTPVTECFASSNPNLLNDGNHLAEIQVEIDADRYVQCSKMTHTHFLTSVDANKEKSGMFFGEVMLAVIGVPIPAFVGLMYSFASDFMLSSPQENDYSVTEGFVTYDKKTDTFMISYSFENFRNGMKVYQKVDNTEFGKYDYSGVI